MHGPLSLVVSPSLILKSYLFALACLLLLALLAYPLPWYGLLLVLPLLAMYFYRCWRQYFSAQRLQGLQHEGGRWLLRYAGGNVEVHLQAATVWPWLVVASYYHPLNRQVYPVLLLADSCQRDDFRRLRVLLKSRKAYQAA